MDSSPAIAIVVVTHDHAEQIGETLRSLATELAPGDEVIVVDNDSRDGTAAAAHAAMPTATVHVNKDNAGFAAGCNTGVALSSAPLVLLLNPDCHAMPGSVAALRDCSRERPEWGAWQALVTLPGGERVNTAGNLVHFLGFGWAGRLDRPVTEVAATPVEVGFASGAALVIRREAWQAAGGFDARYFMYGEDLDLCLRLRLLGMGVGLAPGALVEHDYEFVKGGYKWFYLERNRWWTLLTDYPGALLVLLVPALAAFELALLAAAMRGGWLRPKLRAITAVAGELPAIRQRRREVQARRVISAGDFARALTSSLDSPHLRAATAVPGVDPIQRAYWRAVRSVLR